MSRLRKGLRIVLLGALGLIAAELAWYAVGRFLAPVRAVRVVKNPATKEAPPAFNSTLTILTYNICHARGNDANPWPIRDKAAMLRRLDEIAAMLAKERPDVAVLNEIDFDSLRTGRMNQARFLAEKAGFPRWVEQRNVDAGTLLFFSERDGNALLSRHPIRKATRVSFPGHKRWETILGGKSQAALCDIELAGGFMIRLLATHLASFSEEVRVASAKIIEEKRKSSRLPFLVAGDLNSTPEGFPRHQMYRGENAMDLLLGGGGYTTSPLKSPTLADFTIVVGHPVATIDWVLVPSSWQILERRVLPLAASDHYAVVLKVRMTVQHRL